MRIGWACQRYPQQEAWKVKVTTRTALDAMARKAARTKLYELALGNSERLLALLTTVAQEPVSRRLMRIGSGLWPFEHYGRYARYVDNRIRDSLREVGQYAAAHDIRLSFHPDHFHRLGSNRTPEIADTVAALNVFGEQAELLGVANINVHVWGSAGAPPELSCLAFGANRRKLNHMANSRLTVENDEFGVGLDDVMTHWRRLGCPPVVLDPHHYWVETGSWPHEGAYQGVAQTWACYPDRFPKMHFSQPVTFAGVDEAGLPVLGNNRTHARSHADTFTNRALAEQVLRYAHQFGFDVLCEVKHKDVAALKLWQLAKKLKYVEK